MFACVCSWYVNSDVIVIESLIEDWFIDMFFAFCFFSCVFIV